MECQDKCNWKRRSKSNLLVDCLLGGTNGHLQLTTGVYEPKQRTTKTDSRKKASKALYRWGQQCCKTFFLDTLCISNSRSDYAVRTKKDNIKDERGSHSPPQKKKISSWWRWKMKEICKKRWQKRSITQSAVRCRQAFSVRSSTRAFTKQSRTPVRPVSI